MTMESLLPFIIACPLAFLAGVVDAIGGGGGLISLPGFIMAGLPMHMVLGTNKLSSCMGTSLATFRFWRQGLIQWRRALPCAVCGLVGSAKGANLALLIDDGELRRRLIDNGDRRSLESDWSTVAKKVRTVYETVVDGTTVGVG